MVITLLVAGLLSLAPLADAPKPAPVFPFTEVLIRDGKLVVQGKKFQATAHRFAISADGKKLHLVGTDDEPARLVCRPNGPQTPVEVSGKRIVFAPGEGTVRVEGAGMIVETEPQRK